MSSNDENKRRAVQAIREWFNRQSNGYLYTSSELDDAKRGVFYVTPQNEEDFPNYVPILYRQDATSRIDYDENIVPIKFHWSSCIVSPPYIRNVAWVSLIEMTDGDRIPLNRM